MILRGTHGRIYCGSVNIATVHDWRMYYRQKRRNVAGYKHRRRWQNYKKRFKPVFPAEVTLAFKYEEQNVCSN